jgi:hypothetical protein
MKAHQFLALLLGSLAVVVTLKHPTDQPPSDGTVVTLVQKAVKDEIKAKADMYAQLAQDVTDKKLATSDSIAKAITEKSQEITARVNADVQASADKNLSEPQITDENRGKVSAWLSDTAKGFRKAL